MSVEQARGAQEARQNDLRRLSRDEQSSNDLDTALVNGWLPGNSADEALDRVLRDVTAQYPALIPVSTLVNELDPALAGCPALSPVRIHGERA